MISPIEIIEISGLFNINKGDELICKISELIPTGVEIILIDMNDVSFIDSSGIGALIRVTQIGKESNTEVFICSINDQVKMLFEMTHMDKILNIIEDREQFEKNITAPFLTMKTRYTWN